MKRKRASFRMKLSLLLMLSSNGGAKRILVFSQAGHVFFDEIQKSSRMRQHYIFTCWFNFHPHLSPSTFTIKKWQVGKVLGDRSYKTRPAYQLNEWVPTRSGIQGLEQTGRVPNQTKNLILILSLRQSDSISIHQRDIGTVYVALPHRIRCERTLSTAWWHKCCITMSGCHMA